jgi:hypothetical protein
MVKARVTQPTATGELVIGLMSTVGGRKLSLGAAR